MSIVLLGKKLGMTKVFTENGDRIPVTVLAVEPGIVVAKKNSERDGYDSLQLGFVEMKESKMTKPLQGHFAKANTSPRRYLRESRVSKEQYEQYTVGDVIDLSIFEEGSYLDIAAKSIGKGFAGGVKRWGFKGGRDTHGSMFHRAPGSIGASAYPSRVMKGKKLPGRMGGKRVTAQNVQIISCRAEDSLILVKGAVPGPKGSYVEMRAAKKKSAVKAN